MDQFARLLQTLTAQVQFPFDTEKFLRMSESYICRESFDQPYPEVQRNPNNIVSLV